MMKIVTVLIVCGLAYGADPGPIEKGSDKDPIHNDCGIVIIDKGKDGKSVVYDWNGKKYDNVDDMVKAVQGYQRKLSRTNVIMLYDHDGVGLGVVAKLANKLLTLDHPIYPSTLALIDGNVVTVSEQVVGLALTPAK